MRRPVSIPSMFVLLTPAFALPALGETRRLEVTADNGICAYRQEKVLNTGGRSMIRIKGNDHYYLIGFDAKPVRKWRITRATLHVKVARGRPRRIAACTVPIAWPEGTANNQPQRGASCFTHVKYPDVPWTDAGGTMLEATFNNPRMLWRSAQVSYEGDWMKIPLAAELICAVAHGLSHGLALSEETGQTMENHDVYTREQSSARPYIIVEGQPAGKPGDVIRVSQAHATRPRPVSRPPVLQQPTFRAEPFPPAASFSKGAVRVVISRPAGSGIFANRIRLERGGAVVREEVTLGHPEVVIRGLPPGEKLDATVYSFAGPDVYWSRAQPVQASQAQTVPKPAALRPAERLPGAKAGEWHVELHPAAAKVPPDARPERAVAAMPAPVTPRNAWVGLSAVIYPPNGQAKNFTVHADPLMWAGDSFRESTLKPVQLYRTWYVASKSGQHAEVCVPILPRGPLASLDVPWALNKLSAQTNQQILIDIWVPKATARGPYMTKLIVRHDGKEVASRWINVQVSRVTLPDELHVVGSMNAYDTPARAMGVRPSQLAAFLAAEQGYYRLAHAHRMTLNVLPYSQSGNISWGAAPKIAGRGKDCKVTDWSLWDRRYGPLLSGKAFSAAQGYVGPGAEVPIHHMYLPFHENWPAQMADHFRPWPPPRDYDAFRRWAAQLPPIEKCFDKDHAAAWATVLRQFHDHLRQKIWTRTRLQIYPNNKYYFRRGGRGISLWLLDEPMFADDFLALAYFGRLVRAHRQAAEAGKEAAHPIRYRIDISRPTHQRNWLDGLVQLNVCASQLYRQRRQIAFRRRNFDEEYWNYAMPGSFGRDNLGWSAWPIRSYCWGACGTLPWQTIGSEGDLARADDTALMYPGGKFGLHKPLASLRMKAWRDGLQDAELLHMLRTQRKWTDAQLRAWVGQVCGLGGWDKADDPPADAGIFTFGSLSAEKLCALRRAALAALER